MSISISARTILTFVGLVVLTWMLVAVGGTLLVMFVSVFLAVVLSPVVDAASRRLNLGRGAASSLVVLGLTVLVGLLLLVALSPLIDAVRSFADNVPKIVQHIDNSALGKQLNNHSNVNETLQKHASGIVSGVGKAAGGLLGVAASSFAVVIMSFSVIFMTLFVVKDLPSYRASLLSLLGNDERGALAPDRRRDHHDDLALHDRQHRDLDHLRHDLRRHRGDPRAAPTRWHSQFIAGVLDLIPNIGSTIAWVRPRDRRPERQHDRADKYRDRDHLSTSSSRTTSCSRRSSERPLYISGFLVSL